VAVIALKAQFVGTGLAIGPSKKLLEVFTGQVVLEKCIKGPNNGAHKNRAIPTAVGHWRPQGQKRVGQFEFQLNIARILLLSVGLWGCGLFSARDCSEHHRELLGYGG